MKHLLCMVSSVITCKEKHSQDTSVLEIIRLTLKLQQVSNSKMTLRVPSTVNHFRLFHMKNIPKKYFKLIIPWERKKEKRECEDTQNLILIDCAFFKEASSFFIDLI